MKLHKRSSGEVVIVVPTDRNRSLGIFLVFSGVVAVLPIWYYIGMWTHHPPENWPGWYPGMCAAAMTIIAGFILGWHSHKTILVSPDSVKVWEGFLQRPLVFRWKDTPSVRVQQLEQTLHNHPQITWLVKLVSDRAEYTVDERLGHQLESRWVAEGIAKTLLCSLLMKNEDGSEVQIDPHDLDLPFRERVQKYPALLGHAAPQPASVPIRKVTRNDSTLFSWSMASAGPIFDLLSVTIVFLFISVLPPRHNHPSLLELAQSTHNYSLFVWTGTVIGVLLLLIVGLRTQLEIARDFTRTTEILYGVPVRVHRIPLEEIEEVHVQHGMRGPVVQIVSDRALMQFRLTDTQVAGWFAGEIRSCLVSIDRQAPAQVQDL